MSSNKNSKELIKNFNTNKILAVFPANNSLDRFFYRIPVFLNKRKIDLLQSASKIQVVCQSQNTFKNSFKNSFYNNTSNYKSYSQNDQNNILKSLMQNNIFYEYGKKNKRSNDLLFEHNFDINNFLSQEFEVESSFQEYYVDLSSSFSSKIANNQIKNLRLMILDAKNNIIDETNVLKCDFNNIKRTKRLVDDIAFYQNYFLNSFSDNLNFTIDKNCKNIDIVSSSIIDEKMFDSFSIRLTYLNSKKIFLALEKI